MNSFYDDFRIYEDSAKRVGWYDKLDQDLKFAFVAEMIRPDDSVLDLGSGLGDLAKYLADAGHRGQYLGIEKDAALFKASKERYPNFHFVHQDFMEAPFHTADIAVCVGGLLSAEKVSLSSIFTFLETYPASILIGISEESTSSLRFEDNFVGIPHGEGVLKLNENEVAVVRNRTTPTSAFERLEGLISQNDYPTESIARAFYALGEKKRALNRLRNCDTELAKAMLSAWE